MISLRTRSFLLGKDNELDGRQDALSVNDTSAMYAVADGVSNSFHPEIIARLLCESFTALDEDTLSDWEEYADDILLPMVALRWGTEAENYLNQLSGRMLRHERFNYERWRMGASTFCGAYVDKKRESLRYFIIGDSTLFAHDNEGRMLELNSSPKLTDENGEERTDYSNFTSAVTSDASISGEWLVGELSLEGIDRIALMTDGMAKWYQNMCLRNQDPFEILWGIKDINEFCIVANRVRSEEMEMDDDLAVILIRKVAVAANSKENTDDGKESVAEDESVNEVELTNKDESVNEEEVSSEESEIVEESSTDDESAQDAESDEEEEHAEEENPVDDKDKGRIWDKIKNIMGIK